MPSRSALPMADHPGSLCDVLHPRKTHAQSTADTIAALARREESNPMATIAAACQSCPIEMSVEQFIKSVAGGWDMQHTFQRAEFNDGQVIVCRGHFGAVRVEPEWAGRG